MRLVLLALALACAPAFADSSTPGAPRPGKPARLGRLTITVSPPGAILYIDGKPTDRKLPDISLRLPPGIHRVKFRGGDGEVERKVEVLADLTTFVHEEL